MISISLYGSHNDSIADYRIVNCLDNSILFQILSPKKIIESNYRVRLKCIVFHWNCKLQPATSIYSGEIRHSGRYIRFFSRKFDRFTSFLFSSLQLNAGERNLRQYVSWNNTFMYEHIYICMYIVHVDIPYIHLWQII